MSSKWVGNQSGPQNFSYCLALPPMEYISQPNAWLDFSFPSYPGRGCCWSTRPTHSHDHYLSVQTLQYLNLVKQNFTWKQCSLFKEIYSDRGAGWVDHWWPVVIVFVRCLHRCRACNANAIALIHILQIVACRKRLNSQDPVQLVLHLFIYWSTWPALNHALSLWSLFSHMFRQSFTYKKQAEKTQIIKWKECWLVL